MKQIVVTIIAMATMLVSLCGCQASELVTAEPAIAEETTVAVETPAPETEVSEVAEPETTEAEPEEPAAPSEFELLPFIELNDIVIAQTEEDITDAYTATVRVFDHAVIAGGTAETDADASTVGEYTVTYQVTLDRDAYDEAADAIVNPQPLNADAVFAALDNSIYRDTYDALAAGKDVTDSAVAAGFQQTLIDLGADITADGKVGPATMQAFTDICSVNGITAETVTADAYLELVNLLIPDEEVTALEPVADDAVIEHPQDVTADKTVTVISAEDYAAMLEAKDITEVTDGIAVPAETAEEHAAALLDGTEPDEAQLAIIDAYVDRIPVTAPEEPEETATETQPATEAATAPAKTAPAATQPAAEPATQYVPETQPATQPATQPETQPSTQPAAPPEMAPATQPETQPETQPAAQPETTPAETQPATQPETQPQPAETQPVTEPEPPAHVHNWQYHTEGQDAHDEYDPESGAYQHIAECWVTYRECPECGAFEWVN